MNNEQQKDPHAKSPVQLTMEEIKVLKECRVNSVYYRGIPLGLISLAVGRGILRSGKFPRLKRWSGFFYTGLFGVGFLGGIASYREECTKKILALENSVLADQYRSFMKERGFPVDRNSEFDRDEEQSLSFPTYVNEEKDRSAITGQNVRPNIQHNETEKVSRWDEIRQQSRQPTPEPSRGITYEDLRKRNRSNQNSFTEEKSASENKQSHFVDVESYSSQSFEDRNLAKSGLDFSDKNVADEPPRQVQPAFEKKKTFNQERLEAMDKIAMTCLLVLVILTFATISTSRSLRQTRYVLSDEYKAKSYNFRQRFLVLHYTAADLERSLDILTNQQVSSHYVVPQQPIDGKRKIYRLVNESLRAWTQGVSYWRRRSNLNDQGIGIEIVNLGFKDLNGSRKYFPFPDYQIETVIQLCQDVIKRYQIMPYNVIGHSDCAPGRKTDPGPLFPWKKLYKNGIGAWPNEDDVKYFKRKLENKPVVKEEFLSNLSDYGYKKVDVTNNTQVETVVSSFQLHFRPRKFDGIIDVETYAILKALLRKYFQ